MTYTVALTSVDRPVVLTYEPEGMQVIGRTDEEDTALYLADRYLSMRKERFREIRSYAGMMVGAGSLIWAVSRYLA